jgi:hypothetical protein
LDHDTIRVRPTHENVLVTIKSGHRQATTALSIDQCTALIAAITDAAKVVTGEKA